jgi:N-acetylglutamate synthase-like GNAT family acetyltransferase
LGRVLEHDGCAELCSLGVVESHRRQGIGSKLVNALASKTPTKPLYVVTEIPDYFLRLGFAPSEVYPIEIADKLQRCVDFYDCQSPVVLALI